MNLFRVTDNISNGFRKGETRRQDEFDGCDLRWLLEAGAVTPAGSLRGAVFPQNDPGVTKEMLLEEINFLQSQLERGGSNSPIPGTSFNPPASLNARFSPLSGIDGVPPGLSLGQSSPHSQHSPPLRGAEIGWDRSGERSGVSGPHAGTLESAGMITILQRFGEQLVEEIRSFLTINPHDVEAMRLRVIALEQMVRDRDTIIAGFRQKAGATAEPPKPEGDDKPPVPANPTTDNATGGKTVPTTRPK